MSRMTGGYELGRAGGQCAATGAPLEPGAPIVAALVEIPGEDALSRVDTTAPAWDGGFRPGGLFAFWRTTVPTPDARPRTVIDDDSLADLFASLEPGEDAPPTDRRVVFRYILSLLLVRRKRLIVVSDRSASVLRVRTRGPEDQSTSYDVAVPALDAEALAVATEQLSELIGSGA